MWQYDIKVPPVTKKNSQQIIKVHGRNIIIPSAAYKKYEAQCGQYSESVRDEVDHSKLLILSLILLSIMIILMAGYLKSA